jgi:hypothetical protein
VPSEVKSARLRFFRREDSKNDVKSNEFSELEDSDQNSTFSEKIAHFSMKSSENFFDLSG